MFGHRPEDFEKVMHAPAPEAVILTPVELTSLSAEYVAKSPDLTVHINRNGDWYWYERDAHIIWEEFIKGFRLEENKSSVLVEFIQEAYGWCVTINNVAVISAPSREKITGIIRAIEKRIEERKTANST
jgi:hypothetical protein